MDKHNLKKLNVGCGKDIRTGWINIDLFPLPGVDLVYDIADLPLPFDTDDIDYILCQDIIEHIDFIPVLKEFHRILKKGGFIEIRVPHFSSRFNFIDPTHVRLFSFETFDFFLLGSRRDYYFDFHFNALDTKITFEKGLLLYNYLIEWIVNLNRYMMILFEATFLSRLFPAANLIFILEK